MRILVVDDSVVFRSQIKSAIDGIEGIVVVNTAANGKIALDRLEQNSIDVVILDLEMPEIDGMTVLSEMKKRGLKQKVIVFAATSGNGIDLVFSSLNAGASDFIAKPYSTGSLEQALEGIKKELIPKILQFKNKFLKMEQSRVKNSHAIIEKKDDFQQKIPPTFKPLNISHFKPKIIGIGSSTGGPTALCEIFLKLKEKTLNIPILLAQHMPPNFTAHLAQNLEKLSGHPVREAKQGELILPGNIYIAPGDFHMSVEQRESELKPIIRLDQGPKRNSVRPAVDNLFESIAKIYKDNSAVFVLTGMGEDGKIGAQAIKSASGRVIIQDEESSVVWGMPGAIHASGNFDAMGNLNDCANILIQMIT